MATQPAAPGVVLQAEGRNVLWCSDGAGVDPVIMSEGPLFIVKTDSGAVTGTVRGWWCAHLSYQPASFSHTVLPHHRAATLARRLVACFGR
jgi:hypothetical protein